MSGKIPVRAMEDVDETALSFAEIKALATGNPLIIEKCNLDMEVGKLNMLKASFLNQKYAMEELVLRRYPETIKRLSERISCYEKDLERVANNPKPKEGFAGMVLNGKKYIDKEEAGKKILELCKKKKVAIQTSDFAQSAPFDELELSIRDKNFDIGEIVTIDEYIKYIIVNYQDKFPDTELSKKLGISRKSLWEKRKKYDVSKKK